MIRLDLESAVTAVVSISALHPLGSELVPRELVADMPGTWVFDPDRSTLGT